MSGRSLLLVAQLAPPLQITAAQRVAGLVKFLGRLGLEVAVLTSAVSGEGPVEGASRVARTRDLLASPLNWRRGQLEALAGGGAGYSDRSPVERIIVPDVALASWLPFALPRALALGARHRFDCVLTTSPPQSTHLIGLALRRRGLPWIAELRDGWTFDPPRAPWPTGLQRRIDEGLERRVARGASALVGVTRPITEDLARRFGGRAETVTNAFDPDERPTEELAAGLVGTDRFSLVHTGRMSVVGRDARPLLAAIARLRAEKPRLGERFELVLAGAVTNAEEAALRVCAPDGILRLLGAVDRPRALALQRTADALIVLAHGVSIRSVATGKLFEYLAAGRPILVLGDETEAARIVAETGTGFAVPASDVEAIAAALCRLERGVNLPVRDDVAVARYAYPAVASRLAELVEEVVHAP